VLEAIIGSASGKYSEGGGREVLEIREGGVNQNVVLQGGGRVNRPNLNRSRKRKKKNKRPVF